MVVYFSFNFIVKFGYTDRFFWHKKINPRIIKFDKKLKKKKMLSIIKFSFKGSYRIIIKARYGTIKICSRFCLWQN